MQQLTIGRLFVLFFSLVVPASIILMYFTYDILLLSYSVLLGPFHGAIAVPSVTRCRCRWRRRGHRFACGMRQWRHLVNGRAAARSGEWAQHFSNASCFLSK